jgi:hypothetical protein
MPHSTNRRKESIVATKAAKARGRKPAAAKATAKKTGSPRAVQLADKATFGVDDKRAQYARLIVFNHAVKTKLVGKDVDVNSIPQATLEKAGKDLAGGTYLHGPEGLALIADLSRKGATDEKVASRGLTPAYAAEVRPFIRRLQFSDAFGRRSKPRTAKEETKAPAKKTAKTAPAAPAAPAGNDGDA